LDILSQVHDVPFTATKPVRSFEAFVPFTSSDAIDATVARTAMSGGFDDDEESYDVFAEYCVTNSEGMDGCLTGKHGGLLIL
jgi:hypothetical protein